MGAGISQVKGELLAMAMLAEDMVDRSVKALLEGDAAMAHQVCEDDDQLDQLEGEVDELAMRILAAGPVAGDLRAITISMKISNDIERIGDLATNVAKRAITLAKAPPVASTVTIVRMGVIVQGMIKSGLDSYIARDAHRAMDVWKRDEDVDQLHTSLFREMLTYMMENPRNITPCAHLMFVAKNIERIGDHVTNIAERVLFLVSGEAPGSARPKEDESPFMMVSAETGKDE